MYSEALTTQCKSVVLDEFEDGSRTESIQGKEEKRSRPVPRKKDQDDGGETMLLLAKLRVSRVGPDPRQLSH